MTDTPMVSVESARGHKAGEGFPMSFFNMLELAKTLERENTKLREALESVRQYGSDTLSGRIDGLDDRAWQRAAVLEMTRRARLALGHNVELSGGEAVRLDAKLEREVK